MRVGIYSHKGGTGKSSLLASIIIAFKYLLAKGQMKIPILVVDGEIKVFTITSMLLPRWIYVDTPFEEDPGIYEILLIGSADLSVYEAECLTGCCIEGFKPEMVQLENLFVVPARRAKSPLTWLRMDPAILEKSIRMIIERAEKLIEEKFGVKPITFIDIPASSEVLGEDITRILLSLCDYVIAVIQSDIKEAVVLRTIVETKNEDSLLSLIVNKAHADSVLNTSLMYSIQGMLERLFSLRGKEYIVREFEHKTFPHIRGKPNIYFFPLIPDFDKTTQYETMRCIPVFEFALCKSIQNKKISESKLRENLGEHIRKTFDKFIIESGGRLNIVGDRENFDLLDIFTHRTFMVAHDIYSLIAPKT